MKQNINGILLLDKPIGITSNRALQIVKRLYNAKKAGHTGSLDPLATGMLPICFGEATKFSQILLDADKTYVVEAKLGEKTNTADAEGEVVESKPVEDYSREQLEAVLEKFRGDITQVPSMFSALKHKGKPLYEYARQGITIEREARPVKIFELRLEKQTLTHLTLFVHCSKGTYVRNLVEDIGDVLGCCAHVSALRRIGVNHFPEDKMLSLESIEKLAESEPESLITKLMPVDIALQDWPKIEIDAGNIFYIKQGQAVRFNDAPKTGWLRLYFDGQFIGVGEVLDDGRVAPKRLISTKIA